MNVSSEKIALLKKIMRVRVTRAHRIFREKQEEWNKVKIECDELQVQFDKLQIELEKVSEYKKQNKSNNDAKMRILASDRRHWLIYDQDLVRYDLDVAIDDLQVASKELEKCKANWMRAQHRATNIGERGEEALLREFREIEDAQEADVEDLCLSGVGVV